MNVKLLIQEAYRFSQILAQDGEFASSAELNTGLSLFNKLLRRVSIDGAEIPITTKEDFTLPIGGSEIVLDGWIEILKAQYNLGSILFDIVLLDVNQYRNAARITNTSGIPYVGYARRTSTGITLELFFKPNSDYPMTLDGYKNLTQVTIDQNLSDVSEFMQDYLQIQLAIDLRNFDKLSPNPYLTKQVNMYLEKLKGIKEIRTDVKTHKSQNTYSVYEDTPYLNLSGGWT